MWKDEIVEEVREARRKHTAEHGNDLRRAYEDLKKREEQSGRRVVNLAPRPPRPKLLAVGGG